MILFAPKSDQMVEIEIPDGVKRIACCVSGGADTALLLYILGKYVIENKRDITILPFHICYMDIPAFRECLDVIYKVRELLNCDDKVIENPHFEIFTHKASQFIPEWIQANFLDKGIVDQFYSGLTMNPKVGKFNKLARGRSGEMSIPRRPLFREQFVTDEDFKKSIENDCPLPHPKYPDNFPVYYLESPFVNVDKRFIAEMYDLFNIKDELFPLTRSCVGGFLKTEGFTEPCGECYWCEEKLWAFGSYDVPRESFLLDFKNEYKFYWESFVDEVNKQ